MRDNGPKLSKACINALIADGEISKEEVARHKEKIATANVKPKPEPKRVAKLNDEVEQTMRGIVLPPENKQFVKQTPMMVSETELLDQRTYEALKNRGPHFLVDPGMDSPSKPDKPQHHEAKAADEPGSGEQSGDNSPTEPVVTKEPEEQSKTTSPGREASAAQTVRVDLESAPAVTEKVAPKTAAGPKQTLPAPTGSKTLEAPKKPVKATDYPAGKMSLGKKQSSAQADKPQPSNSQEWEEYMQSRFNGGLNYEGPGARFSKGQ
jgi:hypothetical protein